MGPAVGVLSAAQSGCVGLGDMERLVEEWSLEASLEASLDATLGGCGERGHNA